MLVLVMVLAACGGPPPEPVDVEGCEDVDTVALDAVPTWSDDVAPLVAEHCAACHVDGGIAPFALDDLASAQAWSGAIAHAVSTRQMPPFPPRNCASCNTFEGARWLSDEAIATFVAWAEAEAPEGDRDAPFPSAGSPRQLAETSVTLAADGAYTPDEAVEDDYRCFVVAPDLAVDGFVTGFDVRPGDAREVHHVLVYGLTTADDEAAVAAMDAADPGPGYTCFGGPGVTGTLLAGWAPGGGATMFPAGTGIPIASGRDVVVQVHYNLGQGAFPDLTAVDLQLAPSVERPAQLLPVSASDELTLPPGEPSVEIVHTETLGPGTVWGVAGHMHTRGTSLSMVASDGTCLLDIPVWDFHWQGLYLYETPITSTSTAAVTLTCTFDTRADTAPVTWGEATTDEMCLGYLYVTVP